MRIILTGFMGAGKSTFGAELANICNLEFIDLDNIIENEQKMTISEYFTKFGEKKFRITELKTFNNIIQKNYIVIASGGGTPCYNNLMHKMNASGLTVYLKLSPAQLYDRLSGQKNKRPLLSKMNSKELKQFIIIKLKEREFFYLQSNIIIDPLKTNPLKLSNIIKIKKNKA